MRRKQEDDFKINLNYGTQKGELRQKSVVLNNRGDLDDLQEAAKDVFKENAESGSPEK